MVTCWNHVVFDGFFGKKIQWHTSPWRTAKTPSWAQDWGLNPPRIPSPQGFRLWFPPEAKEIILVVTGILWFCALQVIIASIAQIYSIMEPPDQSGIMTIMTPFCTCFSLFLWLNLYSMPAGLRVSLVPLRCRCYCKADQQERSVQRSNWGSIDANVFWSSWGDVFFF